MAKTPGKMRVDVALVERGFVESRSLAQRMVMAGQIRVDDQIVLKPSFQIPSDAKIEIIERPRFVSRGGEKLAGALEAFQVEINGRICADVGASTGGFTDCLLQNGAAKVFAIDVGHGVLDWQLRQNARVVVMERTNARYLEELPEPVSLVTVDASFISIKLLLPVIKKWFEDSSSQDLIALIKPQFEAGREEATRGAGVIRDPEIHARVLKDVLNFAEENGFRVLGLIRSPITGPKGNVEFLAWLTRRLEERPVVLDQLIKLVAEHL